MLSHQQCSTLTRMRTTIHDKFDLVQSFIWQLYGVRVCVCARVSKQISFDYSIGVYALRTENDILKFHLLSIIVRLTMLIVADRASKQFYCDIFWYV